jgi:secreted trypsin-like serine protease
MRRLLVPSTLAALALSAVSCAPEAGMPREEFFGKAESWIVNGQVDTTHDAVVAVFSNQSGCTATIIHVDGTNAYALTAAHCFGFGALEVVAIGDNYNSPDDVLGIVDYQIHPQYSPQDSSFDFALVRATGASASTPVIPALRPSEDAVQVGTQVDHVGYGLISYPNGQTTVRHHAIGSIAQMTLYQIAYEQPVSGPCSGDSGGPNLVTTPSGERVAGVISYGDEQCNQYGVSGRVSNVYEGFIAPFIGNPEPTTVSSSASTSGAGGSDAGGAVSAGPTVGAGAGWIAGNAEKVDHDGDVVSSCALGRAHRAGARSLVSWLAALGALALMRRRR